MRKISSDVLFYRSLAGNTLGPILIVIFIRVFLANNFSDFVQVIIYLLLAFLTIKGLIKTTRHRKVFYEDDHIVLQTYFTNKTIQVEIKDIDKIERAFSMERGYAKMIYKITYNVGEETKAAYFYKSLSMYNIDIEEYVGIRGKHT